MQNYNIYPKTHIWLCTKKPKEATQLWPVLYSRNSLLHPLSFFFFRCEVKVFTLSGSHQQYQSHLCESFSWKCCTSLKYFSLGLRSRKKEKNYTQRHLKQYFTNEVIQVSAKIFTASYAIYCLAGRLQLRCCEGERGGGEGKGGGWFCCDPVYYFGWGFLLAVWSWRDRQSQQALRTLAGRSPTQRPHGHSKKETEGGEGEVHGERQAELSSEECGLGFSGFSFMFSHFLILISCSSPVPFSKTSSSVLHFDFSRRWPNFNFIHTSIRLSLFSPFPPSLYLSLSSDRHSYPPGRFLSAGLPQQRCSVMWNLISSPPKPDPWPLQSSHSQRGRGAEAGKGGFWEKVTFPKTLLCAHVCVSVCVFVSVQAPNPLCGLCSRVSMCVWLSVCVQTCMGVNFPLYPSVLNCLLNFHACVLYVTAV